MKNLLFLFVFVSCGLGFAQSGAKIEFMAKDNTIDYGTVNSDSDGLRTFTFKNTGDAPLIITNVQSTCGCTVPTKPTKPILPGETGKIDVRYNMKAGTIRKSITVESNAVNYDGGYVKLTIKGEVVAKKLESPLEKKRTMMQQ